MRNNTVGDNFYFLGEHMLIGSGEQRIIYNVYKKLRRERHSKPIKRTSDLVGIDSKLVTEILRKEVVRRNVARKRRSRKCKLQQEVYIIIIII